MKILYLIDDFPPYSWTSSGILTLNLAKKIVEKGNKVFVITTVQNSSFAGCDKFENIDIYKIYTNYNVHWRAYLSLYNYQVVKLVAKIIKEVKPDVCHFQHIHRYLSYYCLKIAKRYCPKVFLTSHDVQLFHYGKFTEFINKNDLSVPDNFNYKISQWQLFRFARKRYNPFRNIIIKHYLKYVDKIFSVSNELKKAMEANNIGNIKTIHNGIETADFDQISEREILEFKNKYNLLNKKIIFFGGRLSYLKGTEMTFYYLEKVLKKISNVVLVVVGGEDEYLKSMQRHLKKFNFNKDKVIFMGFLNRKEIFIANKSCDLAIVPSICFDSFPTANLEAMAARKPVLATCFGGSREIIEDGKTGYIINPFNIEDVIEKIIKIFSNEQFQQSMGNAGYERVRKLFSLDKQVENLLRYY